MQHPRKRVAQDLLRIYAFDHGDKSNGPAGLRLKSGNGDYTYWAGFRTTGLEAISNKQGVLINLDGYAQVEKRAREWKNLLFTRYDTGLTQHY